MLYKEAEMCFPKLESQLLCRVQVTLSVWNWSEDCSLFCKTKTHCCFGFDPSERVLTFWARHKVSKVDMSSAALPRRPRAKAHNLHGYA